MSNGQDLARARTLKRLGDRMAELERVEQAIAEATEKRDSHQGMLDKLGERKLVLMADIGRLNETLDGMR